MNELVLQIVPAAAGWRTVNALLGFTGDLDTAEDEEIIWFEPIACFALIEDNDRARRVVHVTPQDWPSCIVIETGEPAHFMGFLAPAEWVTDAIRHEARDAIRKWREEYA